MSDWLWTSADMVEAMEGRPFGTLPAGITGISIDSRTLKEGEALQSKANCSMDMILQRPPWQPVLVFWSSTNPVFQLSAISRFR